MEAIVKSFHSLMDKLENQSWEERFFKELENATNKHEKMQYQKAGIKSFSPIAPAGDERLYQDHSINLSDTITQAKQKLSQTKERVKAG